MSELEQSDLCDGRRLLVPLAPPGRFNVLYMPRRINKFMFSLSGIPKSICLDVDCIMARGED